LLLRGYQFCLINPTRGKRRNKKTHCKSSKNKNKNYKGEGKGLHASSFGAKINFLYGPEFVAKTQL
jgi:hypothetical protein